jgi:hypothetical protein
MSLFRSVTVGLLGACLYFVVQLAGAKPAVPPESPPAREAVVRVAPRNQVDVIDVASGVSPITIPSLVRLWPGERVASVDDRAVVSDLEAGGMISEAAGSKRFIDLTVESRSASRRVLVLLH